MSKTASVDDLFGLIDKDTVHFRSDLSFILFDKTADVSKVELLDVHLGIHSDKIFLKSVYVSRYIDHSLSLGLLLEDEEDC